MEKRIMIVVESLVLAGVLVACGNRTKIGSVSDSYINEVVEETDNFQTEAEEVVYDAPENDVEELKTDRGFDADFNVYNYYEPDEKILNKVLSDGAYIQIGNTVLEIGKSTLSDFVNAGMDMYPTTAELDTYYGHSLRDEKLNQELIERYLEIYKEHECHWGGTGFLSGDIRVDFFTMGRVLKEENLDDPIIDSVKIEPYAGNAGSVYDYVYGGSKYKDINSIYITGGIMFTGPVSIVSDDYGKIEQDTQEINDITGNHTWTRFYSAECDGTSYTYQVQLHSAEDHCSSILLRLYE